MSRLQPCSACGRHVRVLDRRCPFCGIASGIVAAPSLLSVALLGLCITGCTGEPAKPKPSEPAPTTSGSQPQPTPIEATTEATTDPGPDEPGPTTPPSTTGAGEVTPDPDTGGAGTNGLDDGSTVEQPPPDPVPKPKYGAPRPATKYGGAPRPDDDPF